MTARLLPNVAFTAIINGRHDDGEYECDAEVSGSVELKDDTYDIRMGDIRVGLAVYRPAEWRSLTEQAETALVDAYERAEAAERRHAEIAREVAAVVGVAR